MKSNLSRIAEQINESPFTVNDMIRARIIVNNHEELTQAYKSFKLMPEIVVVRVKNYLDKHLRNITVNFIYSRQIIGELQLLQSSKITIFYAGRFLAQLIRADTIIQFKHIIYQYINRLAEKKKLYYT